MIRTVLYIANAFTGKGSWLWKESHFNPFVKKRTIYIYLYLLGRETWFISTNMHVLGSGAYQAPGAEGTVQTVRGKRWGLACAGIRSAQFLPFAEWCTGSPVL